MGLEHKVSGKGISLQGARQLYRGELAGQVDIIKKYAGKEAESLVLFENFYVIKYLRGNLPKGLL
jgi:hypothetical protein